MGRVRLHASALLHAIVLRPRLGSVPFMQLFHAQTWQCSFMQLFHARDLAVFFHAIVSCPDLAVFFHAIVSCPDLAVFFHAIVSCPDLAVFFHAIVSCPRLGSVLFVHLFHAQTWQCSFHAFVSCPRLGSVLSCNCFMPRLGGVPLTSSMAIIFRPAFGLQLASSCTSVESSESVAILTSLQARQNLANPHLNNPGTCINVT